MAVSAQPRPSGPRPIRRALEQLRAGVGNDWSERHADRRPPGCSQDGGSSEAFRGCGPRCAEIRHQTRGLSGGMATGPPGNHAIESAHTEAHDLSVATAERPAIGKSRHSKTVSPRLAALDDYAVTRRGNRSALKTPAVDQPDRQDGQRHREED